MASGSNIERSPHYGALQDLVDAEAASADFFAEAERKALAGERTLDAIREKFGKDAVTSGRMLKSKALNEE